jgi:hypothetical protein
MGVTQPPTPDVVAAQPGALRPGFKAINSKKVAQVVVALAMLTLAILSIAFYVAGAHKNSQINTLQQHGQTMSVKVSGCEGLLGGSVAFTQSGHHYVESFPGTSFRRPGTVVQAVIAPNDPALLDTPADVRAEHASENVFILPTVLLAVFLLCGGLVLIQRKLGRQQA